MNRDALVERNRMLAEAYHTQPVRHRLRSRLLQWAGRFPFAPLNTPDARILIIRPDHIGDVLLTTPAIHALKQALPHAELHMLAGPWAAPILQNDPNISQVLTLRFPGFDRTETKEHPMEPYTQLLRTSRQLRAVGYTAAFIMRPDHWWGAFLAHAAGIRERVGYALPDVAPFLTTAVPVYNGHAIRQSMRLVEKWTGTLTDEQIHFHLPVDEGDRLSMGEWSQAVDIRADKAIVCIHPGAGTWAKQWEIGRWAQVADALADHYDAQVILTGGSAEASLAEQILSQSQRTHVNAAGALSLGQLAALFQRARLVIGNDSGPMHIAAAVQTPTLTLFGPANPAEFAPWGDRQKHLLLMSNIGCRPCRVLDWGDDPPVNHPCLRDITVPDVLAAAGRLLNA